MRFRLIALRGGDSSTSGGTPSATGPMPETPAELATYYDQKLDWKTCGNNNQCATISVPLDYTRPDAEKVDLALVKVPASGKKIGSLVINPGGPGGSGVDYAAAGSAAFPAALLSRYDLIGFDPRGVGKCAEERADGRR